MGSIKDSIFFKKIACAFTYEASLQQISTGLLIFLAILARTRQYFFNRSLWLDEAMLALNVVNRSFVDLL